MKYIITHEKLKSKKAEQDFIVSALYNEKKQMVEVSLIPKDEETLLGNIYIGRVENVVQNLNAAFVKIAPDQICYFSLEDCKNPLFTKKISERKQITAGEELVVQISREALKTKEPAVTTNLSFTGKYAVLTTGNQKIGISSKLTKTEHSHYVELLQDFPHPDFGLIIRTNAREASDVELLAEIHALKEQWQEIRDTARFKTCFTCLKKSSSAYLKELRDLPEGSLTEIITDDQEICEEYGTSDSSCKIRYYHDPMLSLSSLYSVKASLENALKERVWLNSGAYLIIQPTEALTVIDVNSGKNIAKKDMQENFLKINIEAAKEIAYQLRLRNISGIIVVDFINLTSKEEEALLLKEFRAALKADPVKTDVVDMTKLGLVEVTRKKIKKSLLEICR